MTAYTSNQTGDWGTTSTWSPSGVPGAGDTVTIGAHTVTVSGTETVGTDGAAGTLEIDLGNSSGILNITGTLTVQCSIDVSQGELRIGAGGTLQWDCTNNQYIYMGQDWNGSGKMRVNGTSGSRCTMKKATGGGAGLFYFDFHNGNGMPQDLEMDYCDVTGLGSASQQMMDATLAGTYNDNINFNNVIFDACGDWYQGTFMHADATLIWNNVTFKNSLDTYNASFNWYNSIGTGTRTINACVFDLTPRIWGCQSATVTNNIFGAGFTTINEAVGAETDWSGNFIVHDGTNLAIFQNCTNDIWFINDTGTNPHAIVSPTGNTGNVTYDGLICLLTQSSTDGNGDFIQIGTPGSGSNTVTVQNCILPEGASDNAMTLITALGDAFVDYAAYNNTAFCCSTAAGGDNNSAIVSGETYAGAASSFLCKSNLFYTNVSGATAYSCRDQTGTTSDLAAAADIDYNCSYNTADASALTTNNYSLSAGSHDSNSTNVNPNFAGDTGDANLAAWDTANGGAGTESNALTEMKKLNDSDFDSNYTIASLRTHITGIFAPTNASLQSAGHTSQDIGAVAYTNPSVNYVNRTLGLS